MENSSVCYHQVPKTKPIRTLAVDLIHLAKQLFHVKSSKGSVFLYKHCWLLVHEFPCWVDGWGSMKQETPSKKRATASLYDIAREDMDSESAVDGNGEDTNSILQTNPVVPKLQNWYR